MARNRFILVHPEARRRAMACVAEAAPGMVVIVEDPTKKRAQENYYHELIDAISAQSSYAGKRWDRDDMKRILVDEFADEMRKAGTPLHNDGGGLLIPSEDGRRVIQLGFQTRDFWVKEASDFIEFLQAWGALRGVEFGEVAA